MAHRNKRDKHAGFSLTELLVVVGLIMILATIVGVSLNPRSGAGALGAGQRIAASVFQAARASAILNPSVRDGVGLDAPSFRFVSPKVRVIIHNDPSDPERYRRFMGTIIGGSDLVSTTGGTSSSGANRWAAVNQGTYLPRGLYFVPVDSSELTMAPGVSPQTPLSVIRAVSGKIRSMSIDYPKNGIVTGTDSTGATGDWLVYEFDSTGQSANAGDRLVIATGYRQDTGTGSSTTAEIFYDNPYAVTGFVVRRLGSVTLFDDSDDIQSKVGQH